MNNKIIPVLLLASSLTLGGCFFHGGTQEHINSPTLGQELTDLQSALDDGAISQQEYTRKKEQLISSRKTAHAENKVY